MTRLSGARKILVSGGLLAITLSFALDHYFPTDTAIPVPAPNTLALLAVGGVVAIGLALVRRHKK